MEEENVGGKHFAACRTIDRPEHLLPPLIPPMVPLRPIEYPTGAAMPDLVVAYFAELARQHRQSD